MSWLNNEEGGVQMKKLIVCLSILVLAGSAQAAENVLIGSWESETNEGWYDFPQVSTGDYNPDNTGAWVDWPAMQDPITSSGIGGYSFDYGWSTAGYVSLAIDMMPASGDNGWGNKMATSVANDWLDNYLLEFDVYADDWAQIVCINMNAESTTDGFQTMVGDWSTPLWTQGDATHVVIDIAPFRGDGWAQATDGWINIVFQTQGNTGGHLYLDNVQLLVPEPATIALLGLGGLALLRRKR
jgi:hypothetical protein